MMRGFCPRGFCPEGAYVLMELCIEGFCPRGFCPRGFCPTFAMYYGHNGGRILFQVNKPTLSYAHNLS